MDILIDAIRLHNIPRVGQIVPLTASIRCNYWTYPRSCSFEMRHRRKSPPRLGLRPSTRSCQEFLKVQDQVEPVVGGLRDQCRTAHPGHSVPFGYMIYCILCHPTMERWTLDWAKTNTMMYWLNWERDAPQGRDEQSSFQWYSGHGLRFGTPLGFPRVYKCSCLFRFSGFLRTLLMPLCHCVYCNLKVGRCSEGRRVDDQAVIQVMELW